MINLSNRIEQLISKLHQHVSTADQLAGIACDGNRYELIAGVLLMMSPAGSEHGNVAMAIGASLYNHVRKNQLGVVYAAETGFRISRDPDTVRAPDAAFVSFDRLKTVDTSQAYLEIAPDVAVEVVSPNDVFADVEEKVALWIEAGSSLVLVANPKDQTLRVYRTRETIEILRIGGSLDSGDICRGWQLNVADVF